MRDELDQATADARCCAATADWLPPGGARRASGRRSSAPWAGLAAGARPTWTHPDAGQACRCPSTSPPIPATCWPKPSGRWRRGGQEDRWWRSAAGTTGWSDLPSIFDADASRLPPPVERPLVYHLFGRLGEPDSLVITEDDYFDYLIGVTSNNDLIPGVVRRGAGRLGPALPGLWPGRLGLPGALPQHHDRQEGSAAAQPVRPRGRADRPRGRAASRSRRAPGATWRATSDSRRRHQHLLGRCGRLRPRAGQRSACARRVTSKAMTLTRTPNPYPGPRSFQHGREALRPRRETCGAARTC